jgi:glycosyltransferase involved in cell wall biosynthesis
MDIYPESLLTKLPPILRRMVATPLQNLDRWTARNAEKIVVISENMRKTYLHRRKIAQEKVVTINIWQDANLFKLLPSRQAGCAHYGVPYNRFTFLYLGNIGPVAGIDFLIRTFHHAAIENTQLLIVGDGSAKSRLVEMVKRLRIDNVRFISDPEPKNVPLIQSMGNVCLLPLKRDTGMSSIPSKLAAYMFSAKPVLATVDSNSDTAHAVIQAKGGWVIEPENIEKLAAKMKQIVSLSELELAKIGRNGRKYGFLHFNKSKGLIKLVDIILAAGVC